VRSLFDGQASEKRNSTIRAWSRSTESTKRSPDAVMLSHAEARVHARRTAAAGADADLDAIGAALDEEASPVTSPSAVADHARGEHDGA
jgi:hypothetical protein